MRPATAVMAVLLVLSGMCLSSVSTGQPESNWRNRISTEEGLVEASDILEEIRFGRAVAARIIGRFGLYEDTEIMKYVNLVGQALVRGTNRPEIEFHFAVMNADEPMAFGIPGGYVFVSRGALREMRDEAELAGVLAHELGHIADKTEVRELKIRGIEDTGISGLAQVIGGSADPARVAFQKAVNKALDMLVANAYTKEDEEKADEDAVLLCAMAGYDPSGLVRYLERNRGTAGNQAGTVDVRIERLKAFIVREGADAAGYKTYEKRLAKYLSAIR